ncbi:hypothetical protein QF000_000120 [Paraburkholderia atlantica]|uniref:Uncharacterized protein n=2 Tax=Paraburkholderia TaxID=1822464 RepID=A0A7W8P9B0_9BURK|nr:hypothetical protein [Paraburkholderia youngii]MBB5421134.1 hypothetical protein [Paraburkholderia atlantica]MBB5429145.1 hypothetical protein [Paraburkholderia atlantica]
MNKFSKYVGLDVHQETIAVAGCRHGWRGAVCRRNRENPWSHCETSYAAQAEALSG